MIQLAILAAAATLSLPDINGKLSPDDYPLDALQKGISAAAYVELMTAPDGKPLQCRVVSHLGDAKLADEICRIAMRKRYQPATLTDGSRSHSISKVLLRLFAPGNPGAEQVMAAAVPASLSLQMNRLPDALASYDVRIVVAVNDQGEVTECGPDRTEARIPLATAVCRNKAVLSPGRRSDLSGKAIGYVAGLRVKLVANPG